MKAFVTGASAGLGRAFADQLAERGHDVIGIDRDQPGDGAPFAHWPCDLSDRKAVDELAVRLTASGPLDWAVFNAGVSATGPYEAIDPQAYERLIAVNAAAPMVLCAALAGSGALASGGHVLFVSSLSHFTGYPGAAAYAASKDALAVYARSIRKPFARSFGVSVSIAFPGPLRTAHAARHAPKGANAEKRMPPDEAARLILADAEKGRAVILPGRDAKLFALAGRLAPGVVTKTMRKVIYDKLDGPVW